MEAMLAVLLYCMTLLSTAMPEDFQGDNQTEFVQECITSCSFSTLERAMYEEENHLNILNAFHHPREAAMIGVFTYLVFGLWHLVTELVEESPIYLYDSLQLIIVVLAILVSYELISFREEKIVKFVVRHDYRQ